MSVPMDHSHHPSFGVDPQPTSTPNWTINVPDQIRTVRVSNVSLAVSERDIMEFFSFSGEIHFVDMQGGTETTGLAFVTFKNSQGADRAMLLSGATIADLPVAIGPAENYLLPPHAPPLTWELKPIPTDSTIKNAEEVVSTMLAKGFVLGKDALNRAKSFDERHHLTSNASASLASLDRRMGLTKKISLGKAVVNGKVKEMDEQYQVFEKTKSALAIAGQSVSSAGSVIMSNCYVSTGASWFSSAFNALAKAAEDVSTMTKEKVEKAEEEKKETLFKERAAIITDFASIHLDNSSAGELPVVPVNSNDDSITRTHENIV
ncbi:hypothetical protein LguiA_000730 [Lonicera macranthoides]